jgi:dTDP-4-amino-4,6-dideoxygalactose transaminase
VGVHYPPIHLFALYRGLGFTDGQFPHAERVGAGIVSLPLFPGMDEDDVERVCAAVSEVMRGALA